MMDLLVTISFFFLLWTSEVFADNLFLNSTTPPALVGILATGPLLDSAVAADLVARIQRQCEQQNAFTAEFNQRLVNIASREIEQRSGTFAFLKPHLVRWETILPEKELVVAGEREVWDFFPAEGTAYRYTLEEMLHSKTMLRFISGKTRLDQDFYVKGQKVDASPASLIKLDLVPREPEPGLVQAYVWVDPATVLFKRVLIQDFYGNTNDLEFSNLRPAARLDKHLFIFSPPNSIQILDNFNSHKS
ncbi:outer membrane lipoprotein carrier protein [Desulfovibrionales bacterium]